MTHAYTHTKTAFFYRCWKVIVLPIFCWFWLWFWIEALRIIRVKVKQRVYVPPNNKIPAKEKKLNEFNLNIERESNENGSEKNLHEIHILNIFKQNIRFEHMNARFFFHRMNLIAYSSMYRRLLVIKILSFKVHCFYSLDADARHRCGDQKDELSSSSSFSFFNKRNSKIYASYTHHYYYYQLLHISKFNKTKRGGKIILILLIFSFITCFPLAAAKVFFFFLEKSILYI